MNALNRTVVAPLSSAIIAVLVAGLVVVGVDRVDRTLREGEARLQTRGIVEVSVQGAPFVRTARNTILGRDDRVRVIEGGALLELPKGSVAELRAGSAVAIAATDAAALILEDGDLLVEARQDTVKVDGGSALVSVTGAAKLRRAASLVAGVYEGNVMLQKESDSIGIPRYRQAAAAGTGLLPDTPEPLRLSASDEWDRRLLADVLVLDERLNEFGRGFEAQLPAGEPAGPDLFRSVVPDLAAAPLTPEILAGRAAGENLIGLVLVALDRAGDFDARVSRIFGFRTQGASWGLVAADRNLNPNPVLGNLESALGALAPPPPTETARGLFNQLGGILQGGSELAAAAPVTSGSGGSAPVPAGGGTPPSGVPSTAPAPGADPPAPSPTTPPRRRTIDVPPTGTVLDPLLTPVVDPLETLLSGALEVVLGAPPATTTSPTPTAPTTTTTAPPSGGGLLGGLTSTVGGLLGG